MEISYIAFSAVLRLGNAIKQEEGEKNPQMHDT